MLLFGCFGVQCSCHIQGSEEKRNTTQYIGFAHCIKEKGVERDGDMLGKKTRTEYECSLTLTVYNSRAPGHTGDYFYGSAFQA